MSPIAAVAVAAPVAVAGKRISARGHRPSGPRAFCYPPPFLRLGRSTAACVLPKNLGADSQQNR